ncbi:hypothetical protein HanLR1_Chr00c1736g0817581 [Helianthus annuus]|nr:hypothetical protein HanLR1_Chr00c1736g0817581 [Helianthus annuus]
MAGGDYSSERKLDQTPTWAVAGVCAIIIIISIALEKVLHKLGKVMCIYVFLCYTLIKIQFFFLIKNSFFFFFFFLYLNL